MTHTSENTVTVVKAVWADALGIDHIAPDDDFLELGGHSLLAMRITARVSEEFDIDLPMPVLLRHPTLSRFTAAVERAVREKHGEGT
ncbi:acyl carrier protein [Streptomyces sp. WMMC500]|uniref:acyl carrier protein n=1 Tax=Streptomyces sp. WMMC500 TaxID=3015154 RepID=UPI00248B4735|nr:acyl carrier protein [Streptomyces sp. WMMC500]WBB62055.1 acyl carrier protein [Streptomyces sp. WMMC500]